MKTRGIDIVEGYVLVPPGRAVPDAFWSRLKHRMQLAGRLEEFREDYRARRERVLSPTSEWNSARLMREADAEEDLFRAWVAKLGIELPPGAYEGELLWPWSRGWTEALVDSYLAVGTEVRRVA